MYDELLREVQSGLSARKGEWATIADALHPTVSYSFISQLGRGKYGSRPQFHRLEAIAKYLRAKNIPL